jgi:UDP-glucose 6-dehydrogenase
MLQNGWIHPMHTQVPGSDGSFGFGGKCLPKDLEALVQWTSNAQSSSKNDVLAATLTSHQKQ